MRSTFSRKLFYMGIALGIFVIVYFLRIQIDSVRNSRGSITTIRLPAEANISTSGQLNQELGIQLTGNRVVSVRRDSPAFNAKIRTGDLMTAINGEGVHPQRGPGSLANLKGNQVRAEFFRYDPRRLLSEATLGDVDPTSSTMVLVLGGLRGVASNLLWSQALEMHKQHDWTNLEVVVKSIVKLEPHFISIWTFQGWNLAYNVSVEWDQVEDKYYWIKQGIKFLRQGSEVNEHSPELRWDVGWTYFHKVGKADEGALLRDIYLKDDKPEIDAQGREQPPFNPDEILTRDGLTQGSSAMDNYESGLGWFQKAVNKLDQLNVQPKRMGEVAFRSYPAHSQTNSVQTKEEGGLFTDQIRVGWLDALRLWTEFADHSYPYADGKETKLDYSQEIFGDLYRAVTLMTRVQALRANLTNDWDKLDKYELVEYLRLVWPDHTLNDLEQMNTEDRAKRKVEWATNVWGMIARDTSSFLADFGQPTIDILPSGAAGALLETKATFDKMKSFDASLLANAGSEGDQARKQVSEFVTPAEKLGAFAHEELYWCDRYSTMINFKYWKDRAAAESETETITARRNFFTGMEQFRNGDPKNAMTSFEQGLELWQKVLDKFERVKDDDITREDTNKIVRAYLEVRDQLDLPALAQDKIPFFNYTQQLNAPAMPIQPELMMEMQKMQREFSEEAKGLSPEMQQKKKQELMEKFEALKKQAEQSKPEPK